MTYVWAPGPYTLHAFKNAVPGRASICGYARYPEAETLPDQIPPCKWCASKATPPGGQATGGAHEKGSPWAKQRMAASTRRRDDPYG